MAAITVNAYIESLCNPRERFRSLRNMIPETDSAGVPLFSVRGDDAYFRISVQNGRWTLRCPLSGALPSDPAIGNRLADIRNKNNPGIVPCHILRSEMLVFDSAGNAVACDVMTYARPDGIPLPQFVRSSLNPSGKEALRLLLRNIADMSANLSADRIDPGKVKAAGIVVSGDAMPVIAEYDPLLPGKADILAVLLAAAVNIFLYASEPELYALLGEKSAFDPKQTVELSRHIIAQAQFARIAPLENCMEALTALRSGAKQECDPESICALMSKLATTPFEPLPLLRGTIEALSPETASISINRNDTRATNIHAPTADRTLKVDFAKCEFVGDISDTLIRFSQGGKWNFANKDGDRLTGYDFLSAGDFYEGRAKVATPTGYGVIDRSGAFIMEPVFELLEWHGQDNVISACRDGAWRIYDRMGAMLTPESYDWLLGPDEGFFICRRGYRFGYVNVDGIPLTDIRFDEAYSFRGGRALVIVNGTEYYIGTDGRKI